MEIKTARAGFLSNHEVYTLLKETQGDDPKRSRKHPGELDTVVRDCIGHLELTTPVKIQTPEAISALMAYLNALELEKAEKLQIVNTLPRSLVTLYAVVEECDLRFTEEQCEEMITKVDELFPA